MVTRSRLRALRSPIMNIAAVVLMMVVGLLVAAVSLMPDLENWDAATDELRDVGAVRMIFAILAVLVIPLFRKAPLILMVAGAFCGLVVMTDPFVLAIGLTVLLARAHKTWHWIVVGLGFLVILGNASVHFWHLQAWDEPNELGLVTVAGLLVLCLTLVVSIGMWRRQRRHASVSETKARHAEASTAEIAQELTRQREREDLAREVHDTLASRLSVIALQTGSMKGQAGTMDQDELDRALATTRENADLALTDLRTLLTSLREGGAPTATAASSVPRGMADINDLFEDAAAEGLTVQPFVLLDDYSKAPDPTQRAVVRTLREALTNALRHSSDQKVNVRLQGGPEHGIRMEFTNNTAPESSFEQGSQRGLLGLEERINMLGGVMTTQQNEHEFQLIVRLPWQPPQQS